MNPSSTNISDNCNVQTHDTVLANAFLYNTLNSPNNTAIYINNKAYSYRELLFIVNAIYLKIPKERIYDRIGIYCNNDVYSYASIIAINLYGAAYVPLNNKFPSKRIVAQIAACDLKLILTTELIDNIRSVGQDVEWVETKVDLAAIANISIQIESYRKTNQPIAYILFTSGSTGKPKGVPVSHFNLSSFFNYFLKEYDFNEKDRFLQVYELTFDVSVFFFFMPLLVGACCYVLPDDGVKYLKIMEQLKTHEITVVSMVPTVLRYVAPYLNELSFPSLRYSFFSGDALFYDLAVQWNNTLPNGKIHNFYGPTETTIVCSRYVFDSKKSEKESINNIVPLGKLFEGMSAIIVDEKKFPAKKGELCITGTQVISGYLDNSLEVQFINYEGKRYYKTGDVVSLNAQGDFVFYGRTDNQVKINGYRIELTEIENAISKIVNANVVVLCNADQKAISTITAYLELKQFDKVELRQKLQQTLPEYMVPQYFVAVEKFKLNINEKIDRRQFDNV